MVNEKERLLVKVKYYFEKQLPCHLKTKPTGFVDGLIVSEIIDDIFFWFRPYNVDGKQRMFLVDVYDLKDYELRVEDAE